MEDQTVQEIAEFIHRARLESREIQKVSDQYNGLDITAAYRVQNAGIGLREKDGEKVISLKMGLTSEAKRKQMNLDSPVYGTLTDRMLIPNGGNLSMAGSLHPKAEPEIAFLIGKELKGQITRDQALEATTAVYPALEILDSRFVGFKYFSLEDVIADNSSSYKYCLGEPLNDFRSLDLLNLKIELVVDGQPVQEAPSSAISGDPVLSVIQLAELLEKEGRSIPAGCVVLAGAATPAHPLEPGIRVEARVDQIGEVSFEVTN